MSADPLIVSALFGTRDFAWLDGLRRIHYPPEHNRVPAHLTLFRHLPPSLAPELKRRLGEAARQLRPEAHAAGLINFDCGVAIRIESPALEAIRADLADAFSGLLTPQDAAPWRPHVTIQNKVTPEEARTLLRQLERDFRRQPVAVEGLAVWAYRGGDWYPVSRHAFRG